MENVELDFSYSQHPFTPPAYVFFANKYIAIECMHVCVCVCVWVGGCVCVCVEVL